MEQPTVITLGTHNVLQYLIKYIEMSQTKGAYNLAEADLLKRSVDVVYRRLPDSEINDTSALDLLLQAIHKGQAHGDYTLNDSSLLFNVIKYINENKVALQAIPPPTPAPTPVQVDPSVPVPPTPENDGLPAKEEVVVPDAYDSDNDFDLDELSAPVPLLPREI
jgi:hypothetical protein